MRKKLSNITTATSLRIVILLTFFLNVQANDVTAFGIKQCEIPHFYVKFFIENGSEEIQWQIGAFLVDQFINNEIIKNIKNKPLTIEAETSRKNEKIDEFEQKINKYKELKKKYKNDEKFGWEEVWQLFSELISDEYLEEEILKNFEFEDENWKKIKEIKNWEEMGKEKQNEIIEENLKLLIEKLHQNKMGKLLVNLEEENQNELSKTIEKLSNDSNKEKKRHKFESMKMKMREMVGADWTFKHLEEVEPILMRYDIIESNELFRIYKNILTASTILTKKQENINRLGTAIIFGEIWKFRKAKNGFKIENILKELWKIFLNGELSKEGKSMEGKMLEKLVELKTGIVDPGPTGNAYDYNKKHLTFSRKKKEYWDKILQMSKEQFLKIFEENKIEFKNFLDENAGSRARIMRIFEWKIDMDEIFITDKGNEMTEILRIEFNEETIEEMIRLNYLIAFQTKNEILREKAAMRIFILTGVKYLDEQIGFGSEKGIFENENQFGMLAGVVLRRQWTEKYRPMFFFYLDQTTDSGGDWKDCEKNGIIYRNMLYKLRKYMMERKWELGRKKWDLRHELRNEFFLFIGLFNWKMKTETEFYKDERETLKEENTKIILKLRTKFRELDAAIGNLQFEDNEDIFHFLETGIINKKTSSSTSSISPEIQVYFSWTSNFLETYEKFILERESDDDYEKMNFWKKQVNLDATLWHYKNIFYNLFESIHKKLEISSWPIRYINEWEYLKQYKAENYQTKKQKLCELQYFIQHSLVKNEQIKKLDEWKNFMDLPTIENIFCHADDEPTINYISSIIVTKQTIETKKKIYFAYLDWLISNFEEFQQFLMKLDETYKLNIINILNVENKDGLEKFELFGKLEKKHPKWLQIDEICLDMEMELYKTILKTKDYLPESMISQRRIAMSTLIGEIKKAQNSSEKCEIGKKYPEYFEMIKRKIAELLEEIYEKIGENFDSMENICILTRFKGLIKMKKDYIEDEPVYCLEYNGKENAIKEYTGDLCKQENVQKIAWKLQKQLLGENYEGFITAMDMIDNGETKKLIGKFGGMIRLWSMVPASMNNQLLTEKDKYDSMGNVKLDSLIENKINIARLQSDILEVIEKAEKEIFTKEKIEEIFDEILNKWKYEKHNKEWEENKREKFAEYIKRIHQLNLNELIEQFNTHISLGVEESRARKNFFIQIIESLKNKEAKKIFVELIGFNGIKKIWEKFKPKEDENIQITTNVDEDELKLDDNASKKEEMGNEKKEASITSFDTLEENIGISENVPSSPKISSAEIISEIDTEIAERSENAANPMLIDNKEEQLSNIIHTVDSELHTDKRAEHQKEEVFGENKQNAESKKFIGDSVSTKKDYERKIVIGKNKRGNIKKSRQSKKERKARKKVEREENWRNKARKKAEENKITLEEEKKQINEHLIIEKLKELLKNKGYGEFPDPDEIEENEKRRMASRKKYLNQSEFTILEMMEILTKWNEESRMLISGSMQLKLNSADSDIDLIVLLPYEPSENWENEFEKKFMGDTESKCVGKKCENGDEVSLYCFLCQTEKMVSLEKIHSQVPIIKMQFKRNIPIDINMALVTKELLRNFPTIEQQLKNLGKYKKMKKKMEEIMKKQPNLLQIDELIRNIIIGIGKEEKVKIKEKMEKGKRIENAKEIEYDLKKIIEFDEIVGAKELRINTGDKRNGMLFTLSGYRANKQIVDLLPNEENYRNFQIAYLTLKLWLKNHFIYGGIFGFFNGTTLAVMICKLTMELGENASALKIVEQFFHKFHKNENEMFERIQLEFKKNYENISNILDWFPYENEKGWQVITPGFPTQNAAFQIIPPSDRIINTELGNGLEKFGTIRKLIEMVREPSAEIIHGMLTDFLFSAEKFEDKYSHFMAIVCKYPPKNANGLAFCNFLQLKLRIELPRIHVPQIDYFHIKPEKIYNKICPQQFRLNYEEKFCTIWLAGIKLKDNIKVENVELEAAINWKQNSSSKQLIINIKEEFYKKFPDLKNEKNDKEEEKFDIILHYFSKEGLPKWK